MVMPALSDALQLCSTFVYIGLTETVDFFPIALDGAVASNDDPDELQLLLVTHVRQALVHCRQLVGYSLTPSTFPWAWAGALADSDETRQRTIDHAQQVWDLVLFLERSQSPVHAELAKTLFIREAVVFREPFNMLQASGYRMTDRLEQYIRSLFEHMGSSLSLEAARLMLFLLLVCYCDGSSTCVARAQHYVSARLPCAFSCM